MRNIYLLLFLTFNFCALAQNENKQIDSLIDAANKIGTQNVVKAIELSKKAVLLVENSNNIPLKINAFRTLGTYYYLFW
jgi:hypothetical protein